MPDFDGRREAEEDFHDGLEALAAGDAEAAIVFLRMALKTAPSHRDAMHGLIRALDVAGRHDEALAATQQLIAAAPDDVLARTSLSMVYQHMGMIPEAEKAALDAKLLDWKRQLKLPKSKLLVASTNPGKLRDFEVASGGRVLLEPLPGLKEIPAPAEDELTFEGNATVKAVYYSKFAPGEVVLADDSGLEVDALGGAPGVRSARYAEDVGFTGEGSTDQRNNFCLLAALSGERRRRGRYRCALVAARDGAVLARADGVLEGNILDHPRGTLGFGYDPLFYLPGHARTMAELLPEERLAHSHRGKALAALLDTMEAQSAFFAQDIR